MRFVKVVLVLFFITLFTSFNTQKSSYDVKVMKFLIAKEGYHITQYDKGFIIKSSSKIRPFKYLLFDGESERLQEEIYNMDYELLKTEEDALPVIQNNVYPRIFYQFEVEGKVYKTKDFVGYNIPNSIKNIDKMLTDFKK